MKSSFKRNIMDEKELIIKLIQQDLKHSQLVYGLEKIGLDGHNKHHLQIFDIIYSLMKVPDTIEIEWGMLYQKYMEKSLLIEILGTDTSLKPLAVLCFKHLQIMIDSETKKRN